MGVRHFGDVSDGVFTMAAVIASIAAPFVKEHYENKVKDAKQYKTILSERDAKIALIGKEKNNLR